MMNAPSHHTRYARLLLFGTLLLSLFAIGCNSDPQLSTPAYQQAMALFNACSRKDKNAVELVAQAVATARTNSEITDTEAELLLGVVESARSGSWEPSVARLRSLMENQVTAAPPTREGGARQRHKH